MQPLTRRIEIKNKNQEAFKSAADNFFRNSGCLPEGQEGNTIKYKRPFSIFGSWRFNPLKRYHEITIKINEEDNLASITAESPGQFDPVAEEVFWNRFLDHFIQFYFYETDFREPNKKAIAEIIHANYVYLGYALGAALVGALIALLLFLFAGSNDFFNLLFIPLTVIVVLHFRNKVSRAKFFKGK